MRLAIVMLVSLCACKSAQETVDKRAPDGKKRFLVYQAAVRAALEKPGVFTPPAVPVKLILPGGKKRANADVIHKEWIEMPVQHSDDEVVSEISSNFVQARNLSHGSHPTADGVPSVYERYFDDFVGLEYLVLVTGSISGGVVNAESFVGGGFQGSITVIDVDKQVSLGSLDIASGMSDKVQVVTGEGVKSSVDSQLEFDARQNAEKALEKTLAPLLDPASGPVP